METPDRSDQPEHSTDPLPGSLQLYRAMFRGAPQGMLIQDAEGRVLNANPAAVRILGLSLEQMQGRSGTDPRWRTVAEDGSPVPGGTHLAQDAVRAGKPVENVVLGVFNPVLERTVWIEVTAVPVFRPGDARPFQVFTTVVDITARKQAEDALRKGAHLLRTLIDTLPDLVWLKDAEGRYLACNARFERFFGARERDIVGRTDHDFVARDLADFFLAHDREAMAAGGPTINEERVTFADDGHAEDLETIKTPILGSAGEIIGVLGIGRDITRRKRAEEDVRESAQRLELATTSGSLGVWDRNLADQTEIWNGRMYELYGLAPKTEHPDYACWCSTILHPDDRPAVEAAIRAAIAGEQPYELAFRVTHGDGSVHHIESHGHVLRDSGGKATRIIGINRDRTRQVETDAEQRRLLMELQHADKMESLGSLAGGVAHDINNVLAAIMGMASALRETAPGREPRAQALDTITRACSRGRDVVKSLLYFSRKDLEDVAQVDLNLIAREMVQLLSHTTLQRVGITTDFQDPLGLIQGDAGALSHALINLCVNAVDAMPGGGKLLLRTRNLGNRWIELLVEDSGSGMPREVLEKAMNPFFTTKPQGKGTGLGLAMVYSTVKAHQGQMEIRSEPGRGTSIRMRFPAALPAGLPEPAPEVPPGSQARSLQVMLVDDDDLIRESTEALLEILGCETTALASGEEALGRLEAGAQPGIVILDLNMPGLGGAGTLPRLRALRPALPVLLATGRVDQAALELVEADPLVFLLSKPYSMRELQAQLNLIARG